MLVLVDNTLIDQRSGYNERRLQALGDVGGKLRVGDVSKVLTNHILLYMVHVNINKT